MLWQKVRPVFYKRTKRVTSRTAEAWHLAGQVVLPPAGWHLFSNRGVIQWKNNNFLTVSFKKWNGQLKQNTSNVTLLALDYHSNSIKWTRYCRVVLLLLSWKVLFTVEVMKSLGVVWPNCYHLVRFLLEFLCYLFFLLSAINVKALDAWTLS